MLARLSRNAVFTYGGAVVSKFASLALAIVIARVEGVAAFGLYCFALVLMDGGMRLAIFGTDIIVIREMAARHPGARDLARHVLAWRLSVAPLIYLALLGVAFFFDRNPVFTRLVGVMGIGAVTATIGNLYLSTIQARERLDLYAMVQGGSSLFGVLLGVAALMLGLGIVGVGAAYTARAIVMLVWAMLLCRRAGQSLRPVLNFRAIGSVLRSAAPIGLNGLVTTLYLASGMAVLAHLHGDVDVGRFAGPLKIYEACTAVGALMMTAVFPTISRLSNESPAELRSTVALLVRLFCWGGLALAAVVALHAGQVLRLVFGAGFAGDQAGLMIVMFAVPLSLNFVLVERLAYAAREQGRVFVSRTAGLLANLAVILLFVNRLGYLAAALGILAAELVMFTSLYGGWRRYVREFTFESVAAVPLALAAVLMTVALLLPERAAMLRGIVFAVPFLLVALPVLWRALMDARQGDAGNNP